MSQIRPLPADLQAVAIEQLNEVPERIPADIEALKVWIEQQPHLRARTDDQFLLAFLRGCKFSLEKAKHKIDRWYTLRTKFPDMFACDLDDPKIKYILDAAPSLYLPTPLHGNGPRIVYNRFGVIPADQYNPIDMMRLSHALQSIVILEDDYASIHGLVFIMDCSGLTARHLAAMNPTLMKRTAVFSEQAMPVRPKATHFINTPPGFDVVFNAVKPLFSKKQQDRVHVHGHDLESLYKFIPKEYMPVEFGGKNGQIDEIVRESRKHIEMYRKYLEEEQQYGTDEHLRPGAPINFDGLFGVEGSFRSLSVD